MAIIGHGDIAQALIEAGVDRKEVIFFCSGVSNSGETRKECYEREIKLINGQSAGYHFVYFSSLCIYDSDTMYANHKRMVEEMVMARFTHYTIIRMGNIDWGNNPNTFINYFKNKIKNKEPFEVFKVYRNIVDKHEFIYWVTKIRIGVIDIMNVTGKQIYVPDFVKGLLLNKKVDEYRNNS